MSTGQSVVAASVFFGIPIISSILYRYFGYLKRQNCHKALRHDVIEEMMPSGALIDANSNKVGQWNTLGLQRPLVIAMVGLPARGKSYLVKMIQRYLSWTGYDCEVFNVGKYRRKMGLSGVDSNFFSASNEDAGKLREDLAMKVQEVMYEWLHEVLEGEENQNWNNSNFMQHKRVAIFDATNTTRSRRLKLMERAQDEKVQLLFVESICDDQEVLMKNYMLKLQNDDYAHMDPETALADFVSRVVAYEKVYETITDSENGGNISYIQLINVGQKVITRNCSGYLPSQVAFHLQNVHIQPRRIYLTLTAETSKATRLNRRRSGGPRGATLSGDDMDDEDEGGEDYLDRHKYFRNIGATEESGYDQFALVGDDATESVTLPYKHVRNRSASDNDGDEPIGYGVFHTSATRHRSNSLPQKIDKKGFVKCSNPTRDDGCARIPKSTSTPDLMCVEEYRSLINLAVTTTTSKTQNALYNSSNHTSMDSMEEKTVATNSVFSTSPKPDDANAYDSKGRNRVMYQSNLEDALSPPASPKRHTPSITRMNTPTCSWGEANESSGMTSPVRPNSESFGFCSGMSPRGHQYAIDLTRYIKFEQDVAYEPIKSSKTLSNRSSRANSRDNLNSPSSGSMSDTGKNVLILAGTSAVHLETISHLRLHYQCYNTPLLEELRAGKQYAAVVVL